MIYLKIVVHDAGFVPSAVVRAASSSPPSIASRPRPPPSSSRVCVVPSASVGTPSSVAVFDPAGAAIAVCPGLDIVVPIVVVEVV